MGNLAEGNNMCVITNVHHNIVSMSIINWEVNTPRGYHIYEHVDLPTNVKMGDYFGQ